MSKSQKIETPLRFAGRAGGREGIAGGSAATWAASAEGEATSPLSQPWYGRLKYYGLALLLVAMAAAVRWALADVLGPTPFLVFYLAWVAAAAFGGLGPGLLAAVASWLCVDLFFDSPLWQIGFRDPRSIERLVVLLVGGLAVSVVSDKMRRVRLQERRQARQLAQLAQSLDWERQILQSVMDGARNSHLVYLDRDFNFVRVNEAYARTCGYTPEQMIGKNHFALYPHAENEAIFARVRDKGVPVEVHDKPFVFPDQPERGTTYWDWTLTPIKNESGHVEGLVFSLNETTERKQAEEALRTANAQLQAQAVALEGGTEELRAQAEELADANTALRESEERFHRLFQEDLTGDFLCTREGRIILCNPAFAAIFGFASADEAAGRSMLELYIDPAERGSMLEALKQQDKLGRYEAWRKRLDGTPVYVVENLVGHFDERGELYEIQGYIFDDTERKRAEQALRELNATLESRVVQRTAELREQAGQLQKLALELTQAEDRERRRLAEILHDDIQQILVGAKFHLGIASARCKDDETSRGTLGRVQQLLADAIDKSRSLSHELRPPGLAHSDLRETFQWLAGQMQAKHGLMVHVDAGDRIALRSEPLKALLLKAAQELLFNVIKHAQVGEARLYLRRRGRIVRLAVADKGRGFDPRGLNGAAGSGLLGIRERVNLLGGRMRVRSAEGKGSTFLILVPDTTP